MEESISLAEKEEIHTKEENDIFPGTKKTKKLLWYQCTVNSNAQSKIDYVNACCDFLMQSMGSDTNHLEMYREGKIIPPNPFVSNAKYKSNGFPSLIPSNVELSNES